MSFSDRLMERVQKLHSPLVVGLDPRRDHLPVALPADADPQMVADAYEAFCCEVIEVVAPLVPAVKPQMAFFEQLGPPGMVALHRTIQCAREHDLLVVLDGKRNDIGSTAIAYAQAYLGENSAWRADALTVNPYLGDDNLFPFVEAAHREGAGIFVLVKTSNPGSGILQDRTVDGRAIHEIVAEMVEQMAAKTVGASGYGCVGAVVGATFPEHLAMLRKQIRSGWLLVPGIGAQGGKASDVSVAFDAQGTGALINSSRAIIFAYRRDEYSRQAGSRWQDAVVAATRDTIDQLRVVVPAS